jgi:hypothetical protein
MTADKLMEENKCLEAWIDDLQSGMYINCVYCGHRYGPNSGPNTKDFNITMRKALEQHISECPKHPLSAAKAEIRKYREALTKMASQRICKELSEQETDDADFQFGFEFIVRQARSVLNDTESFHHQKQKITP